MVFLFSCERSGSWDLGVGEGAGGGGERRGVGACYKKFSEGGA